MRKLVFYIFILLLISSCSKRNLTYFSNLGNQEIYTETIKKRDQPTIQPDDILDIKVSSLNPEANSLFNLGLMPNVNSFQNLPNQPVTEAGFLVDHEGNIEYPIIGKIKLGGLTKEEAMRELKELLRDYLKDPIIRIRFLNYRITVIGEVTRPSTFILPSEQINILTALGMAGDLTIYGKRENILLIREEGDMRTITRLNLNDKEVLNSPYFYLQQNDVIYVEPIKTRGPEFANNLRIASIIISIASVASLLLIRLN